MTNKQIRVPKGYGGAEVRAESFNEEDRTVEIIWAAGAAVTRYSWDEGYYTELLSMNPENIRLDRFDTGMSLLDTHDQFSMDNRLGTVVPGSVRIEGGKAYATVKLSRKQRAEELFQDLKDGHPFPVSVGYKTYAYEKREGADRAKSILTAIDWEPTELSAVPVPADGGAHSRSDPEDMPADCSITEIETRTASTAETEGHPMPNTTPVVDAERSAVDANAVETATRAATDAADRAVRAERERAGKINELAEKHDARSLATEYLNGGKTVEEFRAALLDHLASKEPLLTPTTRAQVGTEHAEKRAAVIESVIMHRVDPRANPLPDGAGEFRGMSLIDLARDVLDAGGVKTRGLSRVEIAGEALSQRSGMHSTSDFTVILGNTVNRTLRSAYEAAPQTFRPLVRETTVSDFRSVTRAQLGEAPQLEKVNEHGEFRRGTIGEGSETYKVTTFGKIVGITRQALINDDLGAFTRLAQMFGVQAAQLESDLVWAEILGNPTMGDTIALFHASHKNMQTAAAFSEDTLKVMRAQMAKQVGVDKKTVLNIRPSYLLVPVDLENAAEKLLAASYTPAKTSDAVAASIRSLIAISEPRIDNGVTHPVTGVAIAGSSTAHYLAASPAQTDTVELAYLDGNRGVYTESKLGFNTDGVEVKVRMDAGAKVIDWRAFQKNAGA